MIEVSAAARTALSIFNTGSEESKTGKLGICNSRTWNFGLCFLLYRGPAAMFLECPTCIMKFQFFLNFLVS